MEDLAGYLAPLGYQVSMIWTDDVTTEIRFIRPAQVVSCFEHLGFQSTASDYQIRTYARLTIVPGATQWKGMFVDRLISPPEKKEFGPRIGNKAEKRQWLEWVVSRAPTIVERLRIDEAENLLGRTEHAREAGCFYLATLKLPIENLVAFADGQSSVMTKRQRSAATKMLRTGLITLPYSTQPEEDLAIAAYKIAVNVIVASVEAGDDRVPFTADQDPYRDDDLAWCLQIMASRIYGELGWNLLDGN